MAEIKRIVQEIKENDGTIYLPEKQSDFQGLVNRSQANFQNLRFYKSNPKSLDVTKYWKNIDLKYKELKLKKPHKMKFKEFYQRWKALVVNDYVKRLKELE